MTKPKKILNIEDSMGKHWDINRALNWNGCPNADNATSAELGLAMIEQAIAEGEPYELLVTDMHFPTVEGEDEFKAGLYVIGELKRRGIEIPIILCSSVRYNIPEIVGCVFYSKNRDLNFDFKELLELV